MRKKRKPVRAKRHRTDVPDVDAMAILVRAIASAQEWDALIHRLPNSRARVRR